MAKSCQRCHKKVDDVARALLSVKSLQKIQNTARKNRGDIQQVSMDYARVQVAVSTAADVDVPARMKIEAQAASQRLNGYYQTTQTVKRDLGELRDLQV